MLHERVEVRRARRCEALFVAADEVGGLIAVPEAGFDHRQFAGVVRCLFKVTDAQSAFISDFTVLVVLIAAQDVHQRRFPSAVLRDKSYFLAFGHGKRNVFEKHQIADALRQVLYI